MKATIDEELLPELGDRISQAVVFTQAAGRTAHEAFELVRQIHGDDGDVDDRG
jgi:hypothetical protein